MTWQRLISPSLGSSTLPPKFTLWICFKCGIYPTLWILFKDGVYKNTDFTSGWTGFKIFYLLFEHFSHTDMYATRGLHLDCFRDLLFTFWSRNWVWRYMEEYHWKGRSSCATLLYKVDSKVETESEDILNTYSLFGSAIQCAWQIHTYFHSHVTN